MHKGQFSSALFCFVFTQSENDCSDCFGIWIHYIEKAGVNGHSIVHRWLLLLQEGVCKSLLRIKQTKWNSEKMVTYRKKKRKTYIAYINQGTWNNDKLSLTKVSHNRSAGEQRGGKVCRRQMHRGHFVKRVLLDKRRNAYLTQLMTNDFDHVYHQPHNIFYKYLKFVCQSSTMFVSSTNTSNCIFI